MATVTKILEYRRARFIAPNQNLEDLTRAAWQNFANQNERSVNLRDGLTIAGVRGREYVGGFALHCAKFYEGRAIGVIPMQPADEADLGEHLPGEGENFVNSDFLALIKGNHLICLGCGINASSLSSYLSRLFKKAGMPLGTQQFELVRVGNPRNLAAIAAVGVSRVDLKLSIAEATAQQVVDDQQPQGIWGRTKKALGNAVNSLTEQDATLRQLREAEKGFVTVSINVDKRDVTSAPEGLDTLAGEFIEDEQADGYVIHLRNNTTIKPHEITVKKTAKLSAKANSVDVMQAWEQMGVFYDELTESGQLEA